MSLSKMLFFIIPFLSLSAFSQSLSYGERRTLKKVLNGARSGNSYTIKFALKFTSSAKARKIVNAMSEGTTPLLEAVKGGHINTATALINYGADVNRADQYEDKSPLINSTIAGSYEVNRLLLQRGANVNHKDRYGRTALYYAVKLSLKNIVNQLIQKNAVSNYKDKDGISPLDLAKRTGRSDIQKLLKAVSRKPMPSKPSGRKTYSAADRKKMKDVVDRLKKAKKRFSPTDKDLQKLISPASFKVGVVEKIKPLIQKGASVEVVNKYGNSVITQLAFKIRALNNVPKFARVQPKEEEIKEFYELLELLVQKGANPDRKNTKKDRGYTARTIFEGFYNGKIVAKYKDEKALAILGGQKVADVFETEEEPIIDEKKWMDDCLAGDKNTRETESYCQDQLREFKECLDEMTGQSLGPEEAQANCEKEAEETVTIEEAPELEVDLSDWNENCLKRFETKTGQLTPEQLIKGKEWCGRMFKDFEMCVSDTDASKGNADLVFDKCQDNTYAEGETELKPPPPPQPVAEEEKPTPAVKKKLSVKWKDSTKREVSDLSEGRQIKVALKLDYEGRHSSYKIKFQDIDKDCKTLNLKIRGHKIFGKVPKNFMKCEVSVFAYSFMDLKIHSRPKTIVFTNEKKKKPTLNLEFTGHGKAPQTIKLVTLKPDEKIKFNYAVKNLKHRRIKIKYHFDTEKKCMAKDEWLKVTHRGTKGTIEGTVPKEKFTSCQTTFSVYNVLGEFSSNVTFELACPSCKEEKKEEPKRVLGKSKSFHFLKVPKKWKKYKSTKKPKGSQISLYPLRTGDEKLQKYIDHRNWNPSKIKDLVEKEEASANVKNSFGNTVLAMAIIKNDKALTKFLIKHGANPDIENKKGFSARKFADRKPQMKALLEESLKTSILTKVLGKWKWCNPNNSKEAVIMTLTKLQQVKEELFQVEKGTCKIKKSLNSANGSYRLSLTNPKVVKDQNAFYLDNFYPAPNAPKGQEEVYGAFFYSLIKVEGDVLIIADSPSNQGIDSRKIKFLEKGKNMRFKKIKE